MAQRAAGLGNRARAGGREPSAKEALCRFRGAAQCLLRKRRLSGGIFRTKMTAALCANDSETQS